MIKRDIPKSHTLEKDFEKRWLNESVHGIRGAGNPWGIGSDREQCIVAEYRETGRTSRYL